MRGLSGVAAFCLFSVVLAAADNPFIGTWKLNPAKSKATVGALPKEETAVFEAVGSDVKRTVTGIDADGKPINMSGTIPWDGKEHKVDGPMGPAMVTVKTVNDHTVNVTVKANGKLVSSGRSVVSKDGKTMTASFKGEEPNGKKYDTVEVYDKQ